MPLDTPLNLPDSPTLGQQFNVGGIVWTWDGVKWTSVAPTSPTYLLTTGGTMTGAITLAGNAAQPLDAVPLQQVSTVPVTATGGTVSRTLADRFADVVNVLDFGAVFDGDSHPLSAYYSTLAAAQAVYPHAVALTDEIDGVAIQAAINLCQSRVVNYSYGGTVMLPCGKGLVNRPLTISKQSVSLVSRGDGFQLNAAVNRQLPSAPTQLLWTGAPRTAGQLQSNMLTIAPTDGGRMLSGTNLRGILFHCNQIAGTAGPLIASVKHAVIDCATFEPAGISYPGASLTSGSQTITVTSTAGLRLGESVVSASLPGGAFVASIVDAMNFTVSVQASATSTETVTIGGEGIRFDVVDGLSDSNDTQYLRVRFAGLALAGALNATAPLVLIGGTNVQGSMAGTHFGNTCFCWFDDLYCVYNNGHGVVINNSDHNFHDSLLGQNIGGGPGRMFIVNGTRDSGRVARYHVFNHISYSGTALFAGTDTAGFTSPTIGHRIRILDRDNGAPVPTIGVGATVQIGADTLPVLGFTGGNAPVQVQYQDATAAGGNVRGAYAVDLQGSRAAATQVASGVQSTIGGGRNNVASGQYSVVVGGSGNTASGQGSAVFGGNNNSATQMFALAGGGAALSDTYLTLAFGGVITTGRQSQYNIQVLRQLSAANTTPVTLTADLAAPSTINIVNQTSISGHQCSALTVTLAATDSTNAANSYVWRQQLGLLKKVAGAMSYTPISTPVSGGSGTTTGIAVAEAVDNTNKGYLLTFTPPTGNAVIWRVVATVEWTRVDGA